MTPTETEYDPFEAFDLAHGAGAFRDPYPAFAELRRQSPIRRGGTTGLLAGNPKPVGWDGAPIFTVLAYEPAAGVLKDHLTFSSAGYARSMGMVLGHTILEMDEPEHKAYRGLLEQAFSKQAMARWENQLIAPIVEEFVARFAGRGRADLTRELTFHVPIHVIAGLMGLPDEDLHRFHRWAVELINLMHDVQKGLDASQTVYEYLREIIERRRREPRDDLLSVLATAELDGRRLTDEEIASFARLLLPAGAETTYRSSGNLLFGLLTHPDQLEAVRADRTLLAAAIEEGLRWEPPLVSISRWATKDVEIAGVAVPAGAHLSVCLGSANHDEARWDEPERFNILRKRRQHLAFASGIHTCLGMQLARMETAVIVNAVLDLPSIRLDADADDPHIDGLIFRSPTALPVLFG